MSQPRLPVDPAVREQLMELVRARAPRGRVMTLTEMEEAVTAVMQQVAGTLMDTLVQEQVAQVEKKGARCPAAVGRRGAGGSAPGRS